MTQITENKSLQRPRPNYVELLAKSNFSFLQGASHPEELVHTAQLLGYRGLALCDNGGLYGSVRGYKAAEKVSAFASAAEETAILQSQKRDFQYLVGTELLLDNRQSVTVLPMNKFGYTRLCQLITLAKRNTAKYYSKISLKDFLDFSDDLLVFALPPWKDLFLKDLHDHLGDRLYLPVTRDFTWNSWIYEKIARRLEDEIGLQLFASQTPLMHSPQRKTLHDALTCIFHKCKLDSAENRLTLNRERYLKSLDQLTELWHDRPDLLEVTSMIASRVHFSLSELRYRYPQSKLEEGETASEKLCKLCNQGLSWRYSSTDKKTFEEARARLEDELTLISELAYEDYFLTLKEICQFADQQDILYQGRGSAANSVVCYTLGLTAIDPCQFGQTFARFLSKERGEPPDIDIDFEHERREEVIQHIYEKYGSQHAGMVCTVIRYRGRMAFRELSKVFDIPLEKVNKLAKYMGKDGLKRLIEDPPDFSKLDIDECKMQKILKLAIELIGFPRHIGIHTGGFVISHEALIENVPIEKATMEGRYVVQWNKDDIDTLKMMKIDLLSLGMLTTLRKSLDMLREHRGVDWNLSQIPTDDQATYQMIQKADTVGVFQIESRAQMSMLPRLKPKNFYDLVIEVAIVRPGPLQGGMVHPYLRRRQGREEVTYDHPDLEPVLGRTLGVPIFQEQVMQIASAVAGFSPGEADELRRLMSMSWRNEGHMSQLRQRLISGMLEHGLTIDYAERVYKTIEGFASYGFPESHSASFSLLTYASSFLKCHHPDIFVCGLLNSQPMGFYSPRTLIADAQRHGVEFSPVDIQSSCYDYTIEGHRVRVGLRSIYGLAKAFADDIVNEREKHGHFANLEDLIKRTHLPQAALLRLAQAEAFCSFGISTREAIWEISSLSLDPQSLVFARAKESFGKNHEENSIEKSWLPEESDLENLSRRYQSHGFSLDSHPLSIYRSLLNEQNRLFRQRGWVPFTTAKELSTKKAGELIRTAGLIAFYQRPPTAKGFVFLTLEDETGIMNIVIKPPVHKKYRECIFHRAQIEVQGFLEYQDGVRNIQTKKVFLLEHSIAGRPTAQSPIENELM